MEAGAGVETGLSDFVMETGCGGCPLTNAPNATTGVSPFFANKGYDPAITIHPEYELASSRAHKFVTDLSELHEELQKAILLSQEHYQCSADKNRIPPPDFKVGD